MRYLFLSQSRLDGTGFVVSLNVASKHSKQSLLLVQCSVLLHTYGEPVVA